MYITQWPTGLPCPLLHNYNDVAPWPAPSPPPSLSVQGLSRRNSALGQDTRGQDNILPSKVLSMLRFRIEQRSTGLQLTVLEVADLGLVLHVRPHSLWYDPDILLPHKVGWGEQDPGQAGPQLERKNRWSVRWLQLRPGRRLPHHIWHGGGVQQAIWRLMEDAQLLPPGGGDQGR